MALVNRLYNKLLKAQKEGDLGAVKELKEEIDLAREMNQQGKTKKSNAGSYTVQPGDNWYTIAEKLYGDQRYAGLLMEANGGYSLLKPGDPLVVPTFELEEGELPYFDPALFAASSGVKPFDPSTLTPDQLEDITSRTLQDDLDALGFDVTPTTLPPEPGGSNTGLTQDDIVVLNAPFNEQDQNELALMIADTMLSLGLVPPDWVTPL